MAARAVESSPPVEWQQLVGYGLSELADTSLRRMKRWVPQISVFRATGLALSLPALGRGRPDAASDIYRGRFVFSGQAHEAAGKSIFAQKTADPAWLESLHGFSWLQDLQAGGRELSRIQARAFISDWLAERRVHPRLASRVGVAGRRIISGLRHAPYLLEGCASDFEILFFAGLTAETRLLSRRLATEPNDDARLTGTIGLAQAALGLAGLEGLRAGALARLAGELEQQILPDGGHRSRNPEKLLDLLIDLEPIRMALHDARLEIPADLNAAIERMLPMLRFFVHGDGGLAGFNGMRDPAAGRVKAVLETDAVQGRPLLHAPHSGYCRLAHGHATVIADVGRPPAPGLNEGAGAGLLSFEFSDGPSRIVVNCGTPAGDGEWRRAASLTAAHSTVCLGDQDACSILDNPLSQKVFGTPVLLGPRELFARAETTPEGSLVEARHDGFVPRFGILVERRLWLSASGRDLRGEDRFLADLERAGDVSPTTYALRFHLHPGVKATLSKDRASVFLMLPDRTGWRFSVRGGRLKLEDSVYLTGQTTPRRTQQIVIRGTVGAPDRLYWAFKRIEKRQASKAGEDEPELLL
ncbi:MAG: heparinase II/III family protein [Parvibaculaceae bacterium]